MAQLDSDELRRAIQEAGHAWLVRDFPEDEVHALGALPVDPEALEQARARGRARLTELGIDPDGTVPAGTLPITDPPTTGGPTAAGSTPVKDHKDLKSPAVSDPKADRDWRSLGVIGPVGAQGNCGSCVSFAATNVVSAMAAIEFGLHDLTLSVADEHFSSAHGDDCSGWNADDALDEIQGRGVLTAQIFEYSSAFDHPQKLDSSLSTPKNPIWVSHFHNKPNREEHCYRIADYYNLEAGGAKIWLMQFGPVIATFTVYADFLKYGGNVYRHTLGDVEGSHCVMVVGFSEKEHAWICQNSWGTGWGGPPLPDGTGGGYFKIGYGQCDIDDEGFWACGGVTPRRQEGWRWCGKCQCLNFIGHGEGPCKAGGDHSQEGSSNYSLVVNSNTYPGQDNWRWCRKCQCLAYAGNATLGTCVAGGMHDHSGSGDYRIPTEPAPGSQSDWHWCHKCQCLFFQDTVQSLGHCAIGGEHSHFQSSNYSIGWRG